MKMLSQFYAEGKNGLPKSNEQSTAWLLRAAEGGDTHAMALLASAYDGGKYGLKYGFTKNAAQADYWLRKIAETELKQAEAGDPDSMRQIGDRYVNGYGITKDPVEGNKWRQRYAAVTRKSADAGDCRAITNMYKWVRVDENGEPVSPEQTENWRKLSNACLGQFPYIKELREFVRRTEGAAR